MVRWMLVIAVASVLTQAPVAAQGLGGMGGIGGGGMGGGMKGRSIEVPASLPRPSAEWIDHLTEILSLEKYSVAQYGADFDKFQSPMPYHMVIPQENRHVDAIERLFKAYGVVTPRVTVRPIVQTTSLADALRIGVNNETDLVAGYDWLVANSQDAGSRRVLNGLRSDSQRHRMMFSHALSGGGMGSGGMGQGGMGPGGGSEH